MKITHLERTVVCVPFLPGILPPPEYEEFTESYPAPLGERHRRCRRHPRVAGLQHRPGDLRRVPSSRIRRCTLASDLCGNFVHEHSLLAEPWSGMGMRWFRASRDWGSSWTRTRCNGMRWGHLRPCHMGPDGHKRVPWSEGNGLCSEKALHYPWITVS